MRGEGKKFLIPIPQSSITNSDSLFPIRYLLKIRSSDQWQAGCLPYSSFKGRQDAYPTVVLKAGRMPTLQ
jgi:hypothetical protein